jgi:hypothetical protein
MVVVRPTLGPVVEFQLFFSLLGGETGLPARLSDLLYSSYVVRRMI